MSFDGVREFLAVHAPDLQIERLGRSSSTYTLAADWGIEPAQIAKTLALRVGERTLLLVSCGDSRLDNAKLKQALGPGKARLLPAEEAAELTGHPVGGVCPFALATPMPVYFDIRLKGYDEVVPAAGSTHAALRIDPLRMAELVGGEWVDVCR